MFYLLSYIRTAIDPVHLDEQLADAMHLAVSSDGKHFTALNHNSGVLFAEAKELENGSLSARALKAPWIFKLRDSAYGVIAVPVLPDGKPDPQDEGTALIWTTRDFVHYSKPVSIHLSDRPLKKVTGLYVEAEDGYEICFRTFDGEVKAVFMKELSSDCTMEPAICDVPERNLPDRDGKVSYPVGAIPVNMTPIPENLFLWLKRKLMTPYHVATSFPDNVIVDTIEAFKAQTATLSYSDGSSVQRAIDWELPKEPLTPGTYTLNGTVVSKEMLFPIAYDRADPCIGFWEDAYYFIATNDADQNHSLYIRKANTPQETVTAKEHLFLDSETYEDIGNLLWAPEFHVLDGKLVVLFACTPEPFFNEESHVMILREGGDPLNRADWSRPRRITRADGSEICEAGKEITLDMTTFVIDGEHYVVWSERQFLPVDLGAWLMIAKINEKEPWKLASDPIVLTKPSLSFENNHVHVVEGPYALQRPGRTILTYSGALVDTSYIVGSLTLEAGKDPLIPENWVKSSYPLLTSRSVEGEFGPGHNAYVTDRNGDVWNTYHAHPGEDGPRSSGMRLVHFDADGDPRLDVAGQDALNDALRSVKTVLTITGKAE